MTRAAIDPGSRWIAVTISRPATACPLRYIDARPFEVGAWRPFDDRHPKWRKPRIVNDVEAYTPLGEHVSTQTERDAAADDIAAYLIAHDVEAVDVEDAERAFGATPQAVSKASEYLIVAVKIVERALTIWEMSRKARGLTAPRNLVVQSTWRARLVPLIKDEMRARGVPVEGVLIKGRGVALEPLLASGVAGWPGGRTWGDEAEHVRDSTGLALACALPPLEKAKRKASGPRRPRGASSGKKAPRGSRARAKMGEIDLAKARAAEWRRRDARRPVVCTCREVVDGKRHGGRCVRTCPAYVAKPPPPPICRGCYRPVEGHRLPLCAA